MHRAYHPPPGHDGEQDGEAEDDYADFQAWDDEEFDDEEDDFGAPAHNNYPPASRAVPALPGQGSGGMERRAVPPPPGGAGPHTEPRGREPAPLPSHHGHDDVPPLVPRGGGRPPANPPQNGPARSPRLPPRTLPPPPEIMEDYEDLEDESPLRLQPSPRLPPRGVRPLPDPDSDPEMYEAVEEEREPPPARQPPSFPQPKHIPTPSVPGRHGPLHYPEEEDSPPDEYMEPVETARISRAPGPPLPARGEPQELEDTYFETMEDDDDDDDGEVYTEPTDPHGGRYNPPELPQPRGGRPPPPLPGPEEDYLCPEEENLAPPPRQARNQPAPVPPVPKMMSRRPVVEDPQDVYEDPEESSPAQRRQENRGPALPPPRTPGHSKHMSFEDEEQENYIDPDDIQSKNSEGRNRAPQLPPGRPGNSRQGEAPQDMYETADAAGAAQWQKPPHPRGPALPPLRTPDVRKHSSFEDEEQDTYTDPDEVKFEARELPKPPQSEPSRHPPNRAVPNIPVPPPPRKAVPSEPEEQDEYQDPDDIAPPPPAMRKAAQLPERNNNDAPSKRPTSTSSQGDKIFNTKALRNKKDNLRTISDDTFTPKEKAINNNNNTPEVDFSALPMKERIKLMAAGPKNATGSSPTTKPFQKPLGPSKPQTTSNINTRQLPTVPIETRKPAMVPVQRLSDGSTSSRLSSDDDSVGSGRKPVGKLPVPPQENRQFSEPDVDGYRWYHGPIDRKETEQLLCKHGMFLVRDSSSGGKSSPYTMVIFFNRRVWNLKIRLRSDIKKFALGTEHDDEETFRSVAQLVQHHRNVPITLAGPDGGQLKLGESPDCEQDIYDETTMGR